MPAVPKSKNKESLEGVKQLFDSLKHMTTLSTGSIALLVVVIEKLFSNPEWKFLVVVAVLIFLVSIFCSVTGMFVQSIDTMNIEGSGKERYFERVGKLMAISYYSFFLGVASMVVFFLKNFY